MRREFLIALRNHLSSRIRAAPGSLLDLWLEEITVDPANLQIRILSERAGARDGVVEIICDVVRDHFVDAEVLERAGFARAAAVVRAKLPIGKRIRSGDLAEVLATEYVVWKTGFTVPVKKLRYKDDRDVSMRGNDIVGFRRSGGRTRVLKGEVKSRQSLQAGVVGQACEALRNDDHRPKSATLAFIATILRMEGRDAEAEPIEDLLTHDVRHEDVTHFVFTFSGNNPEVAIKAHAGPSPPITDRRFVGLLVEDHQAFIAAIFGRLDGALA